MATVILPSSKNLLLLLYFLVCLGITFPLYANAAPNKDKPDNTQDADVPQVTIIRRKGRVIEQYRINNQIYMVKIIPSKGYPYYLIDSDGDGSLETRRDGLGDMPHLNQWRIYRW